jgi:hypothetical protein
VSWSLVDGADSLVLEANLSGEYSAGFSGGPQRVLWQEGMVDAEGKFAPYAVRWSIETAGRC